MDEETINIVAVVALSILALSLVFLVFAVLPLISQLTRLFDTVNSITSTVNLRIVPKIADMCGIVDGAKKMVQGGQSLKSKIEKGFSVFKEAVSVGLNSYFKNGADSAVKPKSADI